MKATVFLRPHQAATFNPPLSKRFSSSIGLPLAGTEIQILDDEGKPVALHQAGEIAIRGPQVMKVTGSNRKQQHRYLPKMVSS